MSVAALFSFLMLKILLHAQSSSFAPRWVAVDLSAVEIYGSVVGGGEIRRLGGTWREGERKEEKKQEKKEGRKEERKEGRR